MEKQNHIKAVKTDKQNRKYYTIYSKPCKSVFAFNNKNIVFNGSFKLNIRLGESKFGEEFIFEFLINNIESEYVNNSKYNNIEVYYPKDDGILLLEEFLNYLKSNNIK